MKKVIIIGGGITGLAAAYTIKAARDSGAAVNYTLLEKTPRLGGKIQTERTEDGFVVEGGPDSFISTKPSIFELAKKLNSDNKLITSNDKLKKTYILVKNKLRELPDGVMLIVPTKFMPFIFTNLFSWPGKMRMAMDLFIPRKKPGDETLSSYVKRRLGKECLDRLADPLVAGIYSSDPDIMSLEATFPLLLETEQKYGSLTLGMIDAMKSRFKAHGQGAASKKTLHMSFKGGMQDIVDDVYKALDKDKIVVNADVRTVEELKGADGSIAYRLRMADGTTREADAIILASPANDTAVMINELDKELAAVLNEIPQVSSATVSLAYRKSDVKHDFKGFGFLVPLGEGRKIKACSWSSTKWSGRVPNDDYALVRVFLGGARTEERAFLPVDEMMKLVKAELKDIMGIDAEPIRTWTFRWPKGMPQYTIGHLDRLKMINERANKHPGMFLAGGSYTGVGIPDCISSGDKAAQAAAAYLTGAAVPVTS